MKYVPSIPPPTITGLGERLMVNRLAAVRAVKRVEPRTLPPLVKQPEGQHEPRPERRHETRPQGERRVYCRRIMHLPVLVELRSGQERRHNSQRKDDPREHIDIEA